MSDFTLATAKIERQKQEAMSSICHMHLVSGSSPKR